MARHNEVAMLLFFLAPWMLLKIFTLPLLPLIFF
jgi:hypothetical protein